MSLDWILRAYMAIPEGLVKKYIHRKHFLVNRECSKKKRHMRHLYLRDRKPPSSSTSFAQLDVPKSELNEIYWPQIFSNVRL